MGEVPCPPCTSVTSDRKTPCLYVPDRKAPRPHAPDGRAPHHTPQTGGRPHHHTPQTPRGRAPPPPHAPDPQREGAPTTHPRPTEGGRPHHTAQTDALLTVQMKAEKVPPPLPLSESPASRDGHSQRKGSLLHFRPPAPPVTPVTAGPPDTPFSIQKQAPLLIFWISCRPPKFAFP